MLIFSSFCVCSHYVFPDIVDNKEFYLSTEVRPPFTYASLIRQVSHRNVKTMRSIIFAWEQPPKPNVELSHILFFQDLILRVSLSGNIWISSQSADTKWNLQLVHTKLCIFQAQRSNLEGEYVNSLKPLDFNRWNRKRMKTFGCISFPASLSECRQTQSQPP